MRKYRLHRKPFDNQQLSHQKGDDDLWRYMHDELSKEEAAMLEEKSVDDMVLSDALDGLKMLEKEELNSMYTELNFKLKQQLQRKSRARIRRPIQKRWAFLAVAFIVFFIVMAYVIIYWVAR